MSNISGGYYLIEQDLIRGGLHRHTAIDSNNVSDETLHAVNVVQATPWRINKFVMDVMLECWQTGTQQAGLPAAEDEPLPPPIPDDVWVGMTDEQKTEQRHRRSQIYSRNAKLQGKRETLVRKLDIALQMVDRPEIYFPHFVDFRTRMYPLPQDLNPQGDDVCRGLLEFARGLPLGERGVHWLAVKVATCAGHDKLSFGDREQWTRTNWDLIEDAVTNPLDGTRAWMDFEEPWAFLAAAREWVLAQWSGAPAEFVSHQPIPLDGTCNGLQHLSLLGRDPVGAKATNCGISSVRQDIYQEVANIVQQEVANDAAGLTDLDPVYLEVAKAWMETGITRKTVKRATMTQPYGVTKRGIQQQLIEDRMVADVEGPESLTSAYMRDKIINALSQVIVKGVEIMGYFQTVAEALAKVEMPLSWETPVGTRVTQSYWKMAQKNVKTLSGQTQITLLFENKELGLAKKKQVLGSVPNIIHSLDASMLQQTVIDMFDQGVVDFAMIHDSYGTHACNTDLLSSVLRQVAYRMYAGDWLADFDDYVRSYAPDGLKLPDPPQQENFDVSEVLESEFFFS